MILTISIKYEIGPKIISIINKTNNAVPIIFICLNLEGFLSLMVFYRAKTGRFQTCPYIGINLQLREDDGLLFLVFAFFVGVGNFAFFVGFEEEDLGKTFVGVDLGREGRGIGNFEGDEAFPFRLKGGDVDDDAAAGVGAFAEADGEDVAGDAEVFDSAGKGKGVWGDDANIAFEIDHGSGVEIFGIDDGGMDIGEYFEFVGDADIVAVG